MRIDMAVVLVAVSAWMLLKMLSYAEWMRRGK